MGNGGKLEFGDQSMGNKIFFTIIIKNHCMMLQLRLYEVTSCDFHRNDGDSLLLPFSIGPVDFLGTRRLPNRSVFDLLLGSKFRLSKLSLLLF
jgi:hypothetical protein